jgi:hypothetical protein
VIKISKVNGKVLISWLWEAGNELTSPSFDLIVPLIVLTVGLGFLHGRRLFAMRLDKSDGFGRARLFRGVFDGPLGGARLFDHRTRAALGARQPVVAEGRLWPHCGLRAAVDRAPKPAGAG